MNNRPVVSTSNPGVSMYDHSTGKLLWWTSSATAIQTGTGTVSLPYSSTMYAPNSTGTNDANAFETAVLTGTFTLSSAGAVHFTVGSDDDAFVYLNGVLIGQNPGIHAITDVTFAGNANAGVNTLEIFYADRERTGAQLDVSADVALTAAVPEPSTWAMMILGFFGVGSLAYRRKSQARASAGLAPTLIFFATWEKQLPPGNLTLPGVFVRRPGFSRSKPVVDVGGGN